MINFKQYLILNEAIPLRKALKKGFVRENGGAYKIDKLNQIFKDNDRLVFDIDVSNTDIMNKSFPVLEKLIEIFKSKFPDYTIPDKKSYIQGFAYKKEDSERKRPIRIGKLLNSIDKDQDSDDLIQSYNHDPLRASTKKKNLKVVISRHPYDIAGMSTDRSWTSCMNLGGKGVNYPNQNEGINRRFVKNDIEYGTIVAYLVSDEDKHPNGKIAIKRPIARVLMKPFTNVSNINDVAYSVERVYGTPNSSFVDFVRNWVDTNINTDVEGKKYVVRTGLYWDGKPYMNFNGNNQLDSDFSNVFFSNLYRTSEKYYRNFDVQALENPYGDHNLNIEIRIEYSFDSSVPIEKYRYDHGDSIPKYINQIIDSLGLKDIKRYFANYVRLNTIETFPDDNNLLIFEFNFYLPSPWDPDADEKYIDPRQTKEYHEETFEQFIIESGFDNFDYGSSYKKIRNILMTANIQDERDESLNKLKQDFQNTIKQYDERGKEFTQKIEDFLNFKNDEYKDSINYFNSLGNIMSLNIDDLKNLINSREFGYNLINIKEYKKQHDYLIKQLSYYIPTGNMPLINVKREWGKLEFQYLTTNKEEIKMELDKLESKLIPITSYFSFLRQQENNDSIDNMKNEIEKIRMVFSYY